MVDPEGDYTPLESLPGVVVLGHKTPPTLREVERAVRFPDVSVVVDLSAMPVQERAGYVPALLEVLAAARRQRGFPHRIVVVEAHCFLHGPSAAAVLDLELAAYTLATYKVSGLDPRILKATETIIVTKESDPAEARALHALAGGHESEEHWREALAGLAMNEGAFVTIGGSGNAHPAALSGGLAPDASCPASSQVHGRPGGGQGGLRLHVPRHAGRTGGPHPQRVLGATRGASCRCPRRALARHDFSRWIANVYRDRARRPGR